MITKIISNFIQYETQKDNLKGIQKQKTSLNEYDSFDSISEQEQVEDEIKSLTDSEESKEKLIKSHN